MSKLEIKVEEVECKSVTPIFSYSWPRFIRWVEFWIRTRIFKQPWYLIDKWTLGPEEEMEIVHGVDLEDELTKVLTEEVIREKMKEPIEYNKKFDVRERLEHRRMLDDHNSHYCLHPDLMATMELLLELREDNKRLHEELSELRTYLGK